MYMEKIKLIRYQANEKLWTWKSSGGGNGGMVYVVVVSLEEVAVLSFMKQALRLPTPWGPCKKRK